MKTIFTLESTEGITDGNLTAMLPEETEGTGERAEQDQGVNEGI